MILARTIESAPKDRNILLRFDGLPAGYSYDEPFWIEGWWFANSKEEAEGWETPLGFIGEPTHWIELPMGQENETFRKYSGYAEEK